MEEVLVFVKLELRSSLKENKRLSVGDRLSLRGPVNTPICWPHSRRLLRTCCSENICGFSQERVAVSLIGPLTHQTRLLHGGTWTGLVIRIFRVAVRGLNLQASEHSTGNWILCAEGRGLQCQTWAEKSVLKLPADYIQVIPLTIKSAANSASQTSSFNRITSPWSFLLWVFQGERRR